MFTVKCILYVNLMFVFCKTGASSLHRQHWCCDIYKWQERDT